MSFLSGGRTDDSASGPTGEGTFDPFRGTHGGGDTALDATRSARRLGATDPLAVYRRTHDRMPAHDAELT